MAKRIASGLVALALFLAVLYLCPPVCFAAATALICTVSAYELTMRNGIVKSRVLSLAACVLAAVIPFLFFFGADTIDNLPAKIVFIAMFAGVAVMFASWLVRPEKTRFTAPLALLFAGLVFPMMFSAIVLIRNGKNGEYLLLVPFISAWMTDTGAYFTGMACGKTRLCEKISPKKTVEGAVGGIVSCVLSLLLFGFILERYIGVSINYPAIAVMALVLSCIAQMGDLSFSLIKREYNIKDYGNILPGHGGILDRVDSAMFTVPAAYILIRIIGGIL